MSIVFISFIKSHDGALRDMQGGVGRFATCRESGRTCRTRTTCKTIVSRNLQCAKRFAISLANFMELSTIAITPPIPSAEHTTLCQFQAKKSYTSYASCTSYRISFSAKEQLGIDLEKNYSFAYLVSRINRLILANRTLMAVCRISSTP